MCFQRETETKAVQEQVRGSQGGGKSTEALLGLKGGAGFCLELPGEDTGCAKAQRQEGPVFLVSGRCSRGESGTEVQDLANGVWQLETQRVSTLD